MKNEAKLMKNQWSSDSNSMVCSSTNNVPITPAIPACTALIWGYNVYAAGTNSAIWGTAAIGGAHRQQDFSAIWGTSAANRDR